MINEINLNKLFDIFIENEELTTKDFNNNGFNSNDITNLIKKDIIKRVSRAHYVVSYDVLFQYGNTQKQNRNYVLSNKIFKKCFESKPNMYEACFELLCDSIIKKEYDEFIYIEKLLDSNIPYYVSNAKLFLYMLNEFIDIPSNLKKYLENLTFQELKVLSDEESNQEIILLNKVKGVIFKKNYNQALKSLNNLTSNYEFNNYYKTLKILLIYVITQEKKASETILDLIEKNDYEKIVTYLENKKGNLSTYNKHILTLTKELISINKTKEVPKISVYETALLSDAIKGHNYDLALEIYKNLFYDVEDSAIYMLLLELCKTRDEIILKKQQEKLKQEEKNIEKYYSNLFKSLIENDIDNAFKYLRQYLILTNKCEYEFLIVNLIKLGIVEQDLSFSKAMIVLTGIRRNSFKFVLSKYVEDFYLMLSNNKLKEAKIYLDIISNSTKVLGEEIKIDSLLMKLNQKEQELKNKNNEYNKTNTLDKLISFKDIEEPNRFFEVLKEKEEKVNGIKENNILQNIASEKDFIDKKHQELLKNKGIILLNPMNKERMDLIRDIVSEYSDMRVFSINFNEKKYLVLKYTPYIEKMDIKSLVTEGKKAYKEYDYETSINKFLEVLQMRRPSSYIYSMIGLSYLKRKEINKAISYLMAATDIGKKNNENFDYTLLIEKLMGINKEYDYKPIVKMEQSDFDEEVISSDDELKIERIVNLIAKTGLGVNDACEKLGMNYEEVNIINLLFAKKYYSQGDMKKGDLFLKTVEESKNKTKEVVDLINEIRNNKLFYINRTNEKSKRLSLSIQPRKR